MSNQLEARKERFYDVSSRLACIDSKQLIALAGGEGSGGWGQTATIEVGRSKVFVKRIPVTETEYENMFSTANMFGLPAVYHYGIGSAGFGTFRELAAHVKTTNWVLDGSIANFPLMYHYRIVPGSRSVSEPDAEQHAGYVKYWNGDPNIDRYIQARYSAAYEMIICLEHFPHVLAGWLAKNQDKSEKIIREMLEAIAFLREHGIIHFDAHLGNIVVDGDTPYLTDFGLVLDRSFAIDNDEQAFYKRHADYDAATFLTRMVSYLYAIYECLPPEGRKRVDGICGLGEGADYSVRITGLINNAEKIHAGKLMKLDDGYVGQIVKYRDVTQILLRFYRDMRGNDRKNTPYPHAKIRRLLSTPDKA